MIMIRERNLFCGNVGDSRAVLASLRPLDKPLDTKEKVVDLP
jgi:serine/threonine protein phosphatase PrpC